MFPAEYNNRYNDVLACRVNPVVVPKLKNMGITTCYTREVVMHKRVTYTVHVTLSFVVFLYLVVLLF